MSNRFRMEIVFFMTPAGDRSAPADLGPKEYWIARDDALRWLDDGVICVVSPLDAASQAEIELSEEQEAWLEWLVQHEIQHVRVE
jgi:hypothetical protein